MHPHPDARPTTHDASPEPLWRDVLGARLRAMRLARGLTLVEAAGRAGISPQYLSEIERGRKEPSSEMIAAVVGGLGTTLVDLTSQVTLQLHDVRLTRVRRSGGPVALALAG